MALTEEHQQVLTALRELKGSAAAAEIAEQAGLSAAEVEILLGELAEQQCVDFPEGRRVKWWLNIQNPEELERLQATNNPGNKPVGDFTGRCRRCGWGELWHDATAYGCNCCGMMVMTSSVAPHGSGRDLGPAW